MLLVAASEPKTGHRFAQVYQRRTKREFTVVCQQLAHHAASATKLRLVLDTLNTPNASSFDEHGPAEASFALAERFECIYTPKRASWLNMIACAFSGIAPQCLDRRIAAIEQLRREVLALLEERSAKGITIHWQFSIQAARAKFNAHYIRVNPANQKHTKT